MKLVGKASAFMAVVLGVCLLGLNVYGLFRVDMPEIERPIDREPWSSEQAIQHMAALRLEDPIERKVEVINQAVSRAMIHKSPSDVPLSENYVLHVLQYVDWLAVAAGYDGLIFSPYEYLDPQTGLRRGFGLCSQAARVAAGYAQKYGLQSFLLTLNGHVVAMVRQGGREYIMDPDYELVLPFGLEYAEKNSHEVFDLALKKGWSAQRAETLKNLYATSQDNVVHAYYDYHFGQYWLEKAAYVTKWALPILLLLYGFGYVIIRRRRPGTKA